VKATLYFDGNFTEISFIYLLQIQRIWVDAIIFGAVAETFFSQQTELEKVELKVVFCEADGVLSKSFLFLILRSCPKMKVFRVAWKLGSYNRIHCLGNL